MRTEDVLTASETGLWRWSHVTGLVTLDAIAAELYGLPARAATVPEDRLRVRVHPEDYIELHRVCGLIATEGRVGEIHVRVVTPSCERRATGPWAGQRAGTSPGGPGTPAGPEAGGEASDDSAARSPGDTGAGDSGDPDRAGDSDGTRTDPAGQDLAGQDDPCADETRPEGTEPEDIGPPGEVIRTVRTRMRARREADGLVVTGTVMNLPVPPPHTHPTYATDRADRDWQRSREAFLLEAGRALAEARTTTEVLQVTNSLTLPGFTPQSQAIFGVHGDRLTVLGYHGASLANVQEQQRVRTFDGISINAAYPGSEAARTGQALYIGSPEDYGRRYPDIWDFVRSAGRRAWAYLPLSFGGQVYGVWMAAFPEPVDFTPDERSVLTTVARMLAQALGRTHVFETDRALSADLQHTMAPAARPVIPGAELVARYVPTGGGLQIGGDWYDVIPLASGRVALVVGDVQGHDAHAAAVMAQLRIALRAYAAEGHSPDAVLARASRFLSGIAEKDEERYATCLYLEADPRTGALEAARAGHPDLAVRLPDGTAALRPTVGGPPLGVVPDWAYPVTRTVLQSEEMLLLCTDGLLQNGGHDLHTGWVRLRRVLEDRDDEDLAALADALIDVVHGPPSREENGPVTERREDDMVLLLFRLQQPGDDVRRLRFTVHQAEPGSISHARHQLAQLLHDWADQDQMDGAVLMLSEMLTNALMHTDCDARLTAEISGTPGSRLLRVEVADESDELPQLREPGELASSGRGLLLMTSIADDWGVEPKGEGKSTWFKLYEHEPSSATTGSGSQSS